MFVIVVLAGGVIVLGWLLLGLARTLTPPEVPIPPGEHVYEGLPTSAWRDQLLRPTASNFWPPHDFPLCDHPDPAAVPVLQDLLADPHPEVREAAACCLGHMPSPEPVVVSLLVGAAKDPNARVRLAVLRAISNLRPAAEVVVPVLRAALADDDPKVSFLAAQVFDEFTGQADVVLPIFIRTLLATDHG